MKFRIVLLLTAMATALSSCSVYEWAFKSRKSFVKSMPVSVLKSDTVKGISKLKPYRSFITVNTKSQKGLLTVHLVDDKVYFEIADTLLNRDILIVNRISKGPKLRVANEMFGYAGDAIGENLIKLEKGPNNKLFMRELAFGDMAADTSENGISKSYLKSNLNPIIAVLDIKAIIPDSSGYLVEMTDFIKGDNAIFAFDSRAKSDYKIGGLQSDKSFIVGVKSYTMNTEVKVVKTFSIASSLATYEINSSIVLLPKTPMKPRQADRRVGYFTVNFNDFDRNSQRMERTNFITKWRLEPRPEDMERYKRGELVEPAKPIVYYIDPATPKKWVKYLIQGVNDWQKAFEKAGFKHAIYALEAPKNDPTWSIEDITHNVIVYKPSTVANAMGPHIHDPRTGEILETHLHWYHGVMKLLHDWYMVQAGPNDPHARKMTFDDELMGTLIRFVSSHEIGHTLGLEHNFAASSTIPVEKLRDKRYVEENGFCPSIMDYARFNYVAQPEDHISQRGLMPRIGIYDEWAIEWGYGLKPDFETLEDEQLFNNELVKRRLSKDPRLVYYWQTPSNAAGPNSQSEDLGDNSMTAGDYGIKNLKRVIAGLSNWTFKDGQTPEELNSMRLEVLKQYQRYIDHVMANINKPVVFNKTIDQSGPLWSFSTIEKQRQAVDWINRQVFNTPKWLIDYKIQYHTFIPNQMNTIGNSGNIVAIQSAVLSKLLSSSQLNFIALGQEIRPGVGIQSIDYLKLIKKGVWSELATVRSIDVYRRKLQNAYVMQLGSLLVPSGNFFDLEDKTPSAVSYRNLNFTGAYPLVREHAVELLADVQKAIARYKDNISIAHLRRVRELLKMALNARPNFGAVNKIETNVGRSNGQTGLYASGNSLGDSIKIVLPTDCWQDIMPQYNSSNHTNHEN